MKIIKWILGIAVTLVLVVFVGAFIALQFIDMSFIKEQIQSQAQKATGRTLVIDGDVAVGLKPLPSVTLEQVKFSNAQWSKQPEMFTAGEVSVTLALDALLQGKIAIAGVEISDAIAHLEKNAQGKGNWEFEPSEKVAQAETIATDATTEAPKALPVEIDHVTLKNIDVTYKDANKPAYNVMVSSAEAELSGEPTITAALEYHDLEADIAANAVSMDALLTGVASVDVTASAPGTSLSADVELNASSQPIAVAGPVQFRSENLSALGKAIAMPIATKAPLRFSINLGGTVEKLALNDLALAYDAFETKGNAELLLMGQKPKIIATLSSQGYEVKKKEQGAQSYYQLMPISAAYAQAPKTRILPTDPLPFEGLSAINADITYKLGTLQLASMTLSDVSLKALLTNNVLNAKPVSFKTAQGTVNASLKVDNTQQPVTVASTLTGTGIMLENFLKTTLPGGTKISRGPTNFSYDIVGSGRSLADILGSANGSLSFLVNDAVYQSPALENAKQFLAFLQGGEPEGDLDVACLFGAFDVKEGVAKSKAITLQTDAARVDGKGSFSFANESMSLTLTPRSSLVGFSDLVPPLKVSGGWMSPGVSLDSQSALLGLGKIALGAATGGAGFAALAGLEASNKAGVFAGDNPCIKQAGTKKPAAEQDTRSQTEVIEDNVRTNIKAKEDEVRALRDNTEQKIKDVEKDVKALRDGLGGLFKKD